MSPLEIEAYRGISLKVTGRKLESNQLKMIDKDGRELPAFPGASGFTPFYRGQKLIIPDVPGLVTVETHDSSMTICKVSHHEGKSPPEKDDVHILIEAKGYGISIGEKRPSINEGSHKKAKELEKEPAVVWFGNRKQIKVSWRKGAFGIPEGGER